MSSYWSCGTNSSAVRVCAVCSEIVLTHPTHFELLIHDSDTKFSRAFDEVFRSDGIEVIWTPIRAPNANAFAERWVRIVRSDCLARTITLRRRHLERVLRAYTKHYKEHRPHRASSSAPPNGGNSVAVNAHLGDATIRRQDLLGGLIHAYQRRDQVYARFGPGRAAKS
jgi:putative transposase